MNPAKTLLLAAFSMAALACAAPAAAQWAWRDAAGHMVYSDLPPPSSVPARNIVRQPSAKPALRADALPEAPTEAPAEAKAPPEPTRAAAPPRAPTYVEREIESRQRQQQLAAAEKKAADEDARKAQMAENCARLRAYQRALEGGFRVARLNAAGQQEFLDDAARASETERTRSQIEQQCR
jgi:type IV secretory pathway VirB10-like protein